MEEVKFQQFVEAIETTKSKASCMKKIYKDFDIPKKDRDKYKKAYDLLIKGGIKHNANVPV